MGATQSTAIEKVFQEDQPIGRAVARYELATQLRRHLNFAASAVDEGLNIVGSDTIEQAIARLRGW